MSRRHLIIFESITDFAIIVTDRDGRVTDWNTGAERVLGWTAPELIGQTIERIFTPEDRANGRVEIEMRDALQSGRANDERWHLHRDGRRFWASGEMMPLREEDGSHIGFVKVLRDRTAEHLAGKALETAEARLHQAQEAGGVGLFTVDIASDTIFPTPEFCRIYGMPVQDAYPPSVFEDLIIPEDRHLVSSASSRQTGEAPRDVEYRVRLPNSGEIRWIARKGELEVDGVGRPIRFVGVARDVTNRRISEDRLRRSEAIARESADRVQLALTAGAIIGTWFWDLPNDRFTVDEAFAEAFGLDPDLGRQGLSLEQVVATVHPDDKPALIVAIEEAIARGGAYAHQYRVKRTDGHYYWIEANGRVDHDQDATPLAFPGVLINVEERRSIEAERDRNAAALRALNETLEQRVAERTAELMQAEERLRQAQKMEAVGQLTGGIAHDFNNLLAGISGSLELIALRIQQNRWRDVDKYVQAAQGAANRAAALTHRLLAFSRRQTLDPRPTNVNTLVHGMTELIQRTVGPSILVETVGAAGLWPALVDASQLENALLNLCINARDAMPDGGRITIETSNKLLDDDAARHYEMQPGEFLALCVSDTGCGMPADVIAKAFEPFFTTKPLGKGTGLGLSMIYGFAKQSGGQVRIHSEVGVGSTICIYLPRYVGDVDATADNHRNVALPPAATGATVLVVDDEETIRLLVRDVLEEAGYRVFTAPDGATGLQLLQSDTRVDLLVTDVGLPGGMNGRQVAEAAQAKRPNLKVLFITGYAENALIGSGHLASGMRVLTKPFGVDSFSQSVSDIMQERLSS